MSEELIQFNTTLREFLIKIVNLFPFTEREILKHYRNLLEKTDMNNVEYCQEFMKRAYEYQNDIANKNEKIFHHSICLIPGVDLEIIWNSETNTPKTKKSIWIYLNVFWSLGSKVIEEEKKKEEQLSNLSPDDRIMLNLQEASQEFSQEQVNTRQQFIQSLSDRDLMKEIMRRKFVRGEIQEMNDDEEDLMNFDPTKGYNFLDSIKTMTGMKMEGIYKIIDYVKENFDVDLTSIDYSKLISGDMSVSNMTDMLKELLTPELVDKIKAKIQESMSKFQQDMENGDIDKEDFNQVFNLFKGTSGSTATTSGDGNNTSANSSANSSANTSEENADDLMAKMNEMTQGLFQNLIPPQMRSQFEKLSQDMMKDPSKLMEYMSNPQAMAQEMMQNNPAAMNRFQNQNRGNQARDRLRKKLEAKKQAQGKKDNDDNSGND